MKGIMFKPWKIAAIAANPDKEWQTRRTIKPQPEHFHYTKDTQFPCFPDGEQMKLRYHVGEVVYSKEAWRLEGWEDDAGGFWVGYKGGKTSECLCVTSEIADKYWLPNNIWPELEWRNPRTMPAWAARYFIKITGVEAQRVKEISELDCLTEGYPGTLTPTGAALTPPYLWYANLWEDINGKGSWSSNPWVWVYTFQPVPKPAEVKK